VGNTSGTHMGNTFSALIATRIAVGEADERLHTLSQTPFLRPLEVCDKVCSRSCKMFISLRQNRKCYPCVRSNCYQRPRPQPSPALSSRGGEGVARGGALTRALVVYEGLRPLLLWRRGLGERRP